VDTRVQSTRHTREAARKNIEELERDLAAYPEERAEILMEIAGQWSAIGDDERALKIYDDIAATATEREDVQYAIVEKVHLLDRLGRHDEVRAEVERLASGRVDPGPAALIGEFFETLGELDKALTWFNIACRDLLQDPGEDDELEIADLLTLTEVEGRARVRMALGLPPDELDQRAAGARADWLETFERLADPAPRDPAGVGSYFVRADVKRAFAEGLVHVDDPGDDDVDSYFRRVERGWRESSHQSGLTSMTLLPTAVDDLLEYGEKHGRDPRDQQVRVDYLRDRVDGGARTLHWPPERNRPCWCESGRKYKKCCGSPANR
jgi:tetratricopeptide (TPR) repeat protein